MLSKTQRDSLDVVLVSPRNPLNIGAAARAMANFGFSRLAVVAPFAPNWREARSAVGAPELLKNARESATAGEAVADCTLVVGTGTLTYRKPEQKVVPLPELAPQVRRELARGGRIALLFGPEKHGLTREDLSYCHFLVEIPTDPRQPSMNLGQAVAVCLYELAFHAFLTVQTAENLSPVKGANSNPQMRPEDSPRTFAPEGLLGGDSPFIPSFREARTAPSSRLELLAGVVEEAMQAAGYSPKTMQAANHHELRVMLRRLTLSEADTRRILGLFRRILWGLKRTPVRDDESG